MSEVSDTQISQRQDTGENESEENILQIKEEFEKKEK